MFMFYRFRSISEFYCDKLIVLITSAFIIHTGDHRGESSEIKDRKMIEVALRSE